MQVDGTCIAYGLGYSFLEYVKLQWITNVADEDVLNA
jgi:hypothetical protein